MENVDIFGRPLTRSVKILMDTGGWVSGHIILCAFCSVSVYLRLIELDQYGLAISQDPEFSCVKRRGWLPLVIGHSTRIFEAPVLLILNIYVETFWMGFESYLRLLELRFMWLAVWQDQEISKEEEVYFAFWLIISSSCIVTSIALERIPITLLAHFTTLGIINCNIGWYLIS